MAEINAILDQLGVDKTFFIQLAIVAIFFFVTGPLYFKPFLKLFEARHRRTVEDREAAQKMLEQAQAKLEEYKRRIQEERLSARKELESAILEARKSEEQVIAAARAEAKKIQHETMEAMERERRDVSSKLEVEVGAMAQALSGQLLARKG